MAMKKIERGTKKYICTLGDIGIISINPHEQGGEGLLCRGESLVDGSNKVIKVFSPRPKGPDVNPTDYNMYCETLRTNIINEGMAMAQAQGNHRRTIPFDQLGIARGAVPYIIMPELKGPTLESAIETLEGLSLDDTLVIFYQILEGAHSMHKKNMVHSDIKPHNMILEADDRLNATLIDFGVTRPAGNPEPSGKTVETPIDVTFVGAATARFGGGTRGYIAPEQMSEPEVDGRADIYSLGIVMRYALSGKPPINEKRKAKPKNEWNLSITGQQIFNNFLQRTGKTENGETILNNARNALERLIDRSSATELRERYATSEEMYKELGGIAESLGIKIENQGGSPEIRETIAHYYDNLLSKRYSRDNAPKGDTKDPLEMRLLGCLEGGKIPIHPNRMIMASRYLPHRWNQVNEAIAGYLLDNLIVNPACASSTVGWWTNTDIEKPQGQKLRVVIADIESEVPLETSTRPFQLGEMIAAYNLDKHAKDRIKYILVAKHDKDFTDRKIFLRSFEQEHKGEVKLVTYTVEQLMEGLTSKTCEPLREYAEDTIIHTLHIARRKRDNVLRDWEYGKVNDSYVDQFCKKLNEPGSVLAAIAQMEDSFRVVEGFKKTAEVKPEHYAALAEGELIRIQVLCPMLRKYQKMEKIINGQLYQFQLNEILRFICNTESDRERIDDLESQALPYTISIEDGEGQKACELLNAISTETTRLASQIRNIEGIIKRRTIENYPEISGSYEECQRNQITVAARMQYSAVQSTRYCLMAMGHAEDKAMEYSLRALGVDELSAVKAALGSSAQPKEELAKLIFRALSYDETTSRGLAQSVISDQIQFLTDDVTDRPIILADVLEQDGMTQVSEKAVSSGPRVKVNVSKVVNESTATGIFRSPPPPVCEGKLYRITPELSSDIRNEVESLVDHVEHKIAPALKSYLDSRVSAIRDSVRVMREVNEVIMRHYFPALYGNFWPEPSEVLFSKDNIHSVLNLVESAVKKEATYTVIGEDKSLHVTNDVKDILANIRGHPTLVSTFVECFAKSFLTELLHDIEQGKITEEIEMDEQKLEELVSDRTGLVRAITREKLRLCDWIIRAAGVESLERLYNQRGAFSRLIQEFYSCDTADKRVSILLDEFNKKDNEETRSGKAAEGLAAEYNKRKKFWLAVNADKMNVDDIWQTDDANIWCRYFKVSDLEGKEHLLLYEMESADYVLSKVAVYEIYTGQKGTGSPKETQLVRGKQKSSSMEDILERMKTKKKETAIRPKTEERTSEIVYGFDEATVDNARPIGYVTFESTRFDGPKPVYGFVRRGDVEIDEKTIRTRDSASLKGKFNLYTDKFLRQLNAENETISKYFRQKNT